MTTLHDQVKAEVQRRLAYHRKLAWRWILAALILATIDLAWNLAIMSRNPLEVVVFVPASIACLLTAWRHRGWIEGYRAGIPIDDQEQP